ncbi:hypothetical protein B4O97_09530 [Marispirochaeta aestuarii]|uniref:Radical SAM core domain-containing protein n=1 Tax=Marispirochaeta aestuarii TaxID=1963862 RepID=A0A1Y1RYD9_9SPIO|nr:radical SAM protein [Marispirochaeta aestuarii]ORC35402.1 hypothetical protein B4O97_09530 [Marispirochaeta aestuarii]
MTRSKHNIFRKLKDSDNYILLNPLSKQADILSPELAREYEKGNIADPTEFIEKGYLSDEGEENRRYRNAYLSFIEAREAEEVQVFFVPTYACNFACSYCYQESYDHANDSRNPELTDAFFRWLDTELAGRKKYITVFGGEPLLPSSASRNVLERILTKAADRKLSVAVVTNGYELENYIPLLSSASIREVQVTLDGVGVVHDRRRPLHGGGATFDRIVRGIDAALAAGIPINLRAVVDRENLPHLPELARFAIARGWTGNPLFKTQLGRNYELHTCQIDQKKLYSRISLYEELYALIKENPEFLEFHRPAYSVTKFLFEHGELPDPLFDSCPGTKTEWALDYTGKVYACTATVGKKGEELGTFYPEISRRDEAIEEWEDRDVTSIPECANCNLQLTCGGGCAAVAKNTKGKILSPDCRPTDKLLSMGIPLYFTIPGDK